MPDISALLLNGTTNPWLYLPAAVVLGGLHALEPGHSKSVMAAFVIAVRGTPAQATLLGVSAAVGHTLVVWALALLGLGLGPRLSLERLEPWLILLPGLLIVGLALRLLVSMHGESHGPFHGLRHDHDKGHEHHEPHLGDAHAAAHARDIEKRFTGRTSVTTSEIVWFGFTGGLLPCPAAIAVLLVCLQLKAFTLGIAMVAAFSLGLALTLSAVGVAAAWGTAKAASQWSGFSAWADRLPLISAALVMALGVLMAARGLWQLGLF